MTCKDCIHFEVCKDFQGANLVMNYIHKDNAEQCNHFQDKSKFIELPCKVGDKVYFISEGYGCYELEKEEIEGFDYEIETDMRFVGRDMIGKYAFFDKDQAEAKLKELNNEGEKK